MIRACAPSTRAMATPTARRRRCCSSQSGLAPRAKRRTARRAPRTTRRQLCGRRPRHRWRKRRSGSASWIRSRQRRRRPSWRLSTTRCSSCSGNRQRTSMRAGCSRWRRRRRRTTRRRSTASRQSTRWRCSWRPSVAHTMRRARRSICARGTSTGRPMHSSRCASLAPALQARQRRLARPNTLATAAWPAARRRVQAGRCGTSWTAPVAWVTSPTRRRAVRV
mmetsp:Transcript_2133/g.6386  ORF Transcript_2133/g.6386 Transcript_2133/m.6386 type:complete len:222 (-) Transcript_2133:10-675(-)